MISLRVYNVIYNFKIKKNTLSPEFDETFEYLVAQKELDTKQVEVSLVEDKVMKNPVLGKVSSLF